MAVNSESIPELESAFIGVISLAVILSLPEVEKVSDQWERNTVAVRF